VHGSASNYGVEYREIASVRLRTVHEDEITMNGVTVLESGLFEKKMGSGVYGRCVGGS
jgi:hypothetical protein